MCRLGVAVLTASAYILQTAVSMLIPQRNKEKVRTMRLLMMVDEKGTGFWRPKTWKRTSYLLLSGLTALSLVFLMEFSYSSTFGLYPYVWVVLLKLFQRLLEKVLM